MLEFPQSGEWFRGKANQQAWRERYPTKLDFQPGEIRARATCGSPRVC